MLLASLGIFGAAVLVLVAWLMVALRPWSREWRSSGAGGGLDDDGRRRRAVRFTRGFRRPRKRAPSEVELKSDEEVRYLRRMSELK